MQTNSQKGFSLVEILVVIAIMAALVGILAPMYLSYVEKTRIQKDETAAYEIYRAAEIVVYTGQYDVVGETLVTFNSSGIQIQTGLAQAEVTELLQNHFGNNYASIVPVSKRYVGKTYTITILPPPEGSLMPRISGSWD